MREIDAIIDQPERDRLGADAVTTHGMLRKIKVGLLAKEPAARTILFGIYRGIKTIVVPADAQQIILGLAERETFRYIRRAAKRAKWMIDIGAGNGELSLYFDRHTYAAPIIAVEPVYGDLILQNMVINGASRIEILAQYLGTKYHWQVPFNRIDTSRFAGCGFIRIDTEGAELEILESGETSEKSSPAVAY
jgi:hypothetical protein